MKKFNIIREMYLRFFHLPIEQYESVVLINNDAIKNGDFTKHDEVLLMRINDAMYKLFKGEE